jgi:hypothetical protein
MKIVKVNHHSPLSQEVFMKCFSPRYFLAALLIAVLSGVAGAAVTGRVVNQSASPLASATVRLVNANKSTATAADGRFSFVVTKAEMPVTSGFKAYAVSAENGCISFTIPSDAKKVSIALFEISGRQVAPAFSCVLSAGEYRYDALCALGNVAAGQIFVARVSLDGKAYSFKILSQSGNRLRSQAMRSSGSLLQGMGKRAASLDTLKVSLTGYQTVSVAITSYDGDVGDIALTILAPAAPTSLVAAALSTSSIRLTWADNSNNETGFKLERSPDGTTGWTQIAANGANVVADTDNGLTTGTTYYYRVVAYNAGGNSAYSNTANAATLQQAPAAPSNCAVTALSPTSCRITWTDNSTNETGFIIQREHPSLANVWVSVDTVLANVVTFTQTGLAETWPGYRVRAYNAAGTSLPTAVAYAPQKLRIINDLYDKTSAAGNNWKNLNNIVRVRVGPTSTAVTANSNTYEILCPRDLDGSTAGNLISYITPVYNATTSYKDFDVSSNGTSYYLYLQTGWWETVYDVNTFVFLYWQKRLAMVLNNAGQCCVEKWAWTQCTHNAGYLVVKASDLLPHGSWNGTM